MMMMMMMMMMRTSAKSPASSISSSSLSSSSSSHLVMPTKVALQTEEDALEEEIAQEAVLHDTVIYMQTSDSPDSKESESEKPVVQNIRDTKK
eukprot:4928967-Ditylum_brightwellii.AAC.1